MRNNIELIKPLLIFDSPDTFYHLQILKRKKENPEIGRNSYVVKTYYVNSLEYLEKRMPDIINMCDFNNARAYLNLNPRSFEKIAFHAMKKTADIIMNKDFKSVMGAYESVCGEFGNGKHKRFIIDMDYEDFEPTLVEKLKMIEVKKLLQHLQQEARQEPLMVEIPTRKGVHIITKPFNLARFKMEYPEIDVHKNNPVNLYIP